MQIYVQQATPVEQYLALLGPVCITSYHCPLVQMPLQSRVTYTKLAGLWQSMVLVLLLVYCFYFLFPLFTVFIVEWSQLLMFREQSLPGLGKEARNMVLTFTGLFYYAIIVTLSSWEGNQQAFSPASSTSSVTIYKIFLSPLKVNVVLFLLHFLLICTEKFCLCFLTGSATAGTLQPVWPPFPATVHTASSFFPKPSLSPALWLACALF